MPPHSAAKGPLDQQALRLRGEHLRDLAQAARASKVPFWESRSALPDYVDVPGEGAAGLAHTSKGAQVFDAARDTPYVNPRAGTADPSGPHLTSSEGVKDSLTLGVARDINRGDNPFPAKVDLNREITSREAQALAHENRVDIVVRVEHQLDSPDTSAVPFNKDHEPTRNTPSEVSYYVYAGAPRPKAVAEVIRSASDPPPWAKRLPNDIRTAYVVEAKNGPVHIGLQPNRSGVTAFNRAKGQPEPVDLAPNSKYFRVTIAKGVPDRVIENVAHGVSADTRVPIAVSPDRPISAEQAQRLADRTGFPVEVGPGKLIPPRDSSVPGVRGPARGSNSESTMFHPSRDVAGDGPPTPGASELDRPVTG